MCVCVQALADWLEAQIIFGEEWAPDDMDVDSEVKEARGGWHLFCMHHTCTHTHIRTHEWAPHDMDADSEVKEARGG